MTEHTWFLVWHKLQQQTSEPLDLLLGAGSFFFVLCYCSFKNLKYFLGSSCQSLVYERPEKQPSRHFKISVIWMWMTPRGAFIEWISCSVSLEATEVKINKPQKKSVDACQVSAAPCRTTALTVHLFVYCVSIQFWGTNLYFYFTTVNRRLIHRYTTLTYCTCLLLSVCIYK